MRRARRIMLMLVVFAMTVMTVAPASAVTNGELDGNGHPQVVLVLMEVNGAPAFRCTGTLIAPTFVVTAGHCAGAPGEFSGMRVFTESNVDQGRLNGTNNYPFGGGPNSVEAIRWASHPLYPTAPFYVHDVGMIELAQPINAPYASLPAVDSLDVLANQRGQQDVTFTSVGYGLQAAQLNNPTPQAHTVGVRVRMVSHPKLDQINVPGQIGDFALLLSNNTKTGGTCFGDSGGPNFLNNSNTIAAVTSFGKNNNCAGTGGVFRLDRQNVQDFINDFMGL